MVDFSWSNNEQASIHFLFCILQWNWLLCWWLPDLLYFGYYFTTTKMSKMRHHSHSYSFLFACLHSWWHGWPYWFRKNRRPESNGRYLSDMMVSHENPIDDFDWDRKRPLDPFESVGLRWCFVHYWKYSVKVIKIKYYFIYFPISIITSSVPDPTSFSSFCLSFSLTSTSMNPHCFWIWSTIPCISMQAIQIVKLNKILPSLMSFFPYSFPLLWI